MPGNNNAHRRSHSTDLTDHKGLLRNFAMKWWTRMQEQHVVIDFDDVLQDIYIAAMAAVRGYDPERGYSFTAYLGRSVDTAMMKRIARLSKQEGFMVRMDGVVALEEDGAGSCYNLFISDFITPDQLYEQRSMLRERMACLDPIAQQAVAAYLRDQLDADGRDRSIRMILADMGVKSRERTGYVRQIEAAFEVQNLRKANYQEA